MDIQLNHWEEDNWTLYRKRYAENITTARQSETYGTVEILPSRSGLPTMRITTKTGQSVFLHSSIDPIKEAQRVTDGLEVTAGAIVVVYGLGLGYLVETLLKQLDKRTFLFVIEPDQAVFQQAMRTRDLRHLLDSDRVSIQVSDSPIDIQKSFYSIYDAARFHDFARTGLPGHQVVYKDLHIEVIEGIKRVVNLAVDNWKTLAKIGSDVVSSTILNFVDYCTHPGVASLTGKFSKIPAIVVAAGPSLNRNIEMLREAKGRAVIIAVGTAMKVLQKHDIIPDFIVSIDPQPITYEHFRGHICQNSALLTAIQSYPEVVQTFKGPIFVAASGSFILNWFDDLIEAKEGLETGGTVAHSAMTEAYNMGADPIIFLGQDLAFAHDGQTHAAGTSYSSIRYTDFDENTDVFYVKANDGGQVLTNHLYNDYRLFIEDWIQVKNDRTYINATEGGALIAGAQIMTLREVLTNYCNNPVDVMPVVVQVQQEFCSPNVEQAIAILYRRLADANHILEEVLSARKRLKQLRQAFEKKDIDKMHKYAHSIDKIFRQFDQDRYIRPVVEMIAHHTIQYVRHRQFEALYAENKNDEAAIADYGLYCEKIHEGVKLVKDLITQAIKYAEEEQV